MTAEQIDSADPMAGALDTQAMERLNYRRRNRSGMLIAAGVHGIFAIAGLLVHAPELFYLQAVSISVYLVSWLLTRWHWNQRLLAALTYLDLLGHSSIAAWIVGVDAGFQFYSWCLLPLVFTNINRSSRQKIITAGVLIVVFIATDALLHLVTPLATLAHSELLALRYFNIFCFLLMMSAAAIGHIETVEQNQARLRSVAGTDSLTGLPNRRRMSDRMKAEWRHASASAQPLAVLLMDIDHFKSINDRFGHGSGDVVLAGIAAALAATMRKQDIVARWGGEEFLILLPGATKTVAADMAERIRRTIATMSFPQLNEQPSVTTTIGVANWRTGETLDQTIHRADMALYHGKRNGRDRVVEELHSPVMARTA